jgi:hypothetical protein
VRYLFERPENDDEAAIGWANALSSIGGIQLFLQTSLSGNTTVAVGGIMQPFALLMEGPLAASYFSAGGQTIPGGGSCNYTVQDPTVDIIRRLNTVMFLASMQIANSNASTPIRNVKAEQFVTVQFYKTNYAFLAGGIATILVAMVGAAAPFYGFWQLGRRVTLGPIEIASAFQAPLLRCSSASSGEIDELIKRMGVRQLQYGRTAAPDSPNEQLAFADPGAVTGLKK